MNVRRYKEGVCSHTIPAFSDVTAGYGPERGATKFAETTPALARSIDALTGAPACWEASFRHETSTAYRVPRAEFCAPMASFLISVTETVKSFACLKS